MSVAEEIVASDAASPSSYARKALAASAVGYAMDGFDFLILGFMIKVAAPNIALKILDDAIQAHGGGGVSDDFPLAHQWAAMRTLRFADGPDEVHNRAIARNEFGKYADYKADIVSSGDIGVSR